MQRLDYPVMLALWREINDHLDVGFDHAVVGCLAPALVARHTFHPVAVVPPYHKTWVNSAVRRLAHRIQFDGQRIEDEGVVVDDDVDNGGVLIVNRFVSVAAQVVNLEQSLARLAGFSELPVSQRREAKPECFVDGKILARKPVVEIAQKVDFVRAGSRLDLTLDGRNEFFGNGVFHIASSGWID